VELAQRCRNALRLADLKIIMITAHRSPTHAGCVLYRAPTLCRRPSTSREANEYGWEGGAQPERSAKPAIDID
jgi:hypothetical protein